MYMARMKAFEVPSVILKSPSTPLSLKRAKNKTRELLEGTNREMSFLNRDHWFTFRANQSLLTKSKYNKIALVARLLYLSAIRVRPRRRPLRPGRRIGGWGIRNRHSQTATIYYNHRRRLNCSNTIIGSQLKVRQLLFNNLTVQCKKTKVINYQLLESHE